MTRRSSTVVKFPIGRVVREHRIAPLLAATPEAEAIDQAFRSVEHAMKSLERQRASLQLRWNRVRKKETPEQHARLVERNMRRIVACQDEDRAAERAAAPPPDARTRRALRKLIDEWDAKAGGDGDSAA